MTVTIIRKLPWLRSLNCLCQQNTMSNSGFLSALLPSLNLWDTNACLVRIREKNLTLDISLPFFSYHSLPMRTARKDTVGFFCIGGDLGQSEDPGIVPWLRTPWALSALPLLGVGPEKGKLREEAWERQAGIPTSGEKNAPRPILYSLTQMCFSKCWKGTG
jgi:hypothetical protein